MRGPEVERQTPHGVPGLIRRCSEAAPAAVALVDIDGAMTYRELEVSSDQLAERLRAAGGRPAEIVAVCVPRGRAMVVAMLAAMKVGMPYLPLSPEDPPARQVDLLRRSEARFVLAAPESAGLFADVGGVTVVEIRASGTSPGSGPDSGFAPLESFGADHPVYVLYTSGSSGAPKGVVVPVLALCNRLLWMCEEYGFGPSDRILQKTPCTFDVSGWELWAPLISGGRGVLLPPGAHRDPGEVIDWVTGHGVTVCHFVPSMLEEFLRWPSAATCTSLRMVVCSGEALAPGQVRRFGQVLSAELHNLYGPTEAAIDVTHWRCPADGDPLTRVLIGRPIANCTVVLVDDHLMPVPPGETGQLAIGGTVLGTGYLHRPDLTAAAFVAAPAWTGVSRLYLTGDLARWHGDDLEYLGRKDNQVKVRGHRIEPTEIEDLLRDQAQVRDAAVVDIDLGGGIELCAVVVPAEDLVAAELAERLRAAVRARLPEVYVPAHVLTAPAIPLTSSGKQDKRRLRDDVRRRLTTAGTDDGATAVPPGDELVGYWVEALGRAPRDEQAGFLAEGGHSLAAARLLGRILARWGVRLSLTTLLRADMSLARLRQLLPQDAPPAATGHVRRSDRRRAPIAPEQRRLWLWTRLFPDCPAYNVVGVLDIADEIEVDRLRAACATVIGRHEALRTTFGPDGDEQLIAAQAPVLLRVRSAGGPSWEESVREFATEVAATVFVPARLPRIAFGLLRHAPEEVAGVTTQDRYRPARSALVVAVDHLVADQRSLDVLLAELSAYYAAPPPALPDPAQFGDLVVQRAAAVDPARRDRDLRYWRERLSDAEQHLELPFRKPRPELPSFAGAVASSDLGVAVRDAIDATCRQHRVTPAVLALTCFARTLAAWSGRPDVVVGVPMSGRELADELDAVGFFVKTLPVRIAVPAGAGVTEMLAPVADAVFEAAEHGSVTFDEIVTALQVERGLSRNPIFGVWFNDLTRADPPATFGGRTANPVAAPMAWSLFDLGLYFDTSPDGGYRLRLSYATELWDAPVAAEFLGQCRARLLDTVSDTVPARPAPHRPATAPPETTAPPPATCSELVAQVIAHARHEPHRPALVTERGVVTYGDLDVRLRQVSSLVRASARPGQFIAIRARRHPDLAAAVLGCWHAGSPVLLLAADAAPGWCESALAEAAPAMTLTLEAAQLAGVAATEDPAVPIAPGRPGHALATSGTSGEAAVVVLPAEALPESFAHYRAELELGSADVFCFTVPPAHDPVFRDLVLPLTLGAKVWIPWWDLADPRALLGVLEESEATVLHITPSRALLLAGAAAGHRLPRLRRVVFHGELLREQVAGAVREFAPDAELVNIYGTTETPQASGFYRWQPPGDGTWRASRPSVPVYSCAPHRRLEIHTATGEAQVGEVGELTVTGSGLALGYLGATDRAVPAGLHDDASLPPPDRAGRGEPTDARPALRSYRTGDLARRDPDGAIEVLGRLDRQISVHGYRVEAAGVERVLTSLPGVTAGAVALAGPDVLTAWLSAERSLSTDEIVGYLRTRLPEWSIPARFVQVAALPVNRNGKVDFAALLSGAVAAEPPAGRAAREPQIDELIALILTQAGPYTNAGATALTPDTNFFDAGLTSMGLVHLHAQLTGRAGLDGLALPDLFNAATPRRLAEHLAGTSPGGRWTRQDRPPARHRPGASTDELTARRAVRAKFRPRATSPAPRSLDTDQLDQ